MSSSTKLILHFPSTIPPITEQSNLMHHHWMIVNKYKLNCNSEIWMSRRKYQHIKWKHFFFFLKEFTFLEKKNHQTNIHIFLMSESVRASGVLWYFSSLLLILRGLRWDPEKTFWNGPELAVWLFGNPLLFLSLFYNLIKSALCFATFQALISGLGRVKRPRQFEKGSLHHKEAACSQSFPSSTPPRQKKRGREQEGHSLAHYRENLMKVL